MSLFKANIIGNLGNDVELNYSPSGMAVAKFSVATTEKVKSKDDKLEDVTTWLRCVSFGKLAETCAKYLAKGSKVYLEGKVRLEEWQDKDGNNKSTLNLNVSDVQFLSKSEKSEIEESTKFETKAKAKAASAEDDDSLPF